MYTLGHLMVSSDDDMRPYALVEDSPESLGPDEISRGKLLKASWQAKQRASRSTFWPPSSMFWASPSAKHRPTTIAAN